MESRGLSPRALLAAILLLVVSGGIAFLASGSDSGADEERSAGSASSSAPRVDPDGPNPIVGSIDVNPADGSLWLSTNTGLFRVPKDGDRPELVTGLLTTHVGSGHISEQLVIRFRGPDDLIASGHAPSGEALPEALGMIASSDGGRTWTGLGEVGFADFHAIQLSGDVIAAGFHGAPQVAISRDGGKTFDTRVPPGALIDLEIDPQEPARWIGSTDRGLVVSTDEARTWRPVEPVPNVRFSWPASDTLYRIDPGGQVKRSFDGGETWARRGSTGGEPQALFAPTRRHLYVALSDGAIGESRDGGRTWTARVAAASG
jgi:hypothetical protein